MQQTYGAFGQYIGSGWAPGQAFNNCFLVRKPGMPVPFLSMEGGREVDVAPQYAGVTAADGYLLRRDRKKAWHNIWPIPRRRGRPCFRLTMGV